MYMFFLHSRKLEFLIKDLYPILLNGLNVQHVSNTKHLYNILAPQIRNIDLCIKKGVLPLAKLVIYSKNSFAHSAMKCLLRQKYSTSFYGCEFW